MYLLGFDIGSSTVKAALVETRTHQVAGVVTFPDHEMDMISRQPGWAEQQPAIWWENLCYASQQLLKKCQIHPNRIKAIGIGYQMHGLVLVDNEKHVLRPSIIWCDSRAVGLGEEAFQGIGPGYCLEHYLNSPANFTASKLKWVKDNEPEIFGQGATFMLPGDYIAMRMTNEVATTIPGLSEAILWDFKKHRIATEVLDYYGISKEMIPDVIPTFGIQGKLTRQAANAMGLIPGIPVTYRAGDQPNNALSLKVLQPGEIAATSGTSGVVYGVVDKLLYDDRSRINAFAHVNHQRDKNRIGILLCLNGAGIQYSWIKHQVSRPGNSYWDMERMMSSVPVGSDGLCILPFGNGAERMLNNRNLDSHLFNIQFNRHTRAHLYRAAVEGVAFSFVYGMNILKKMGLNIDVIRVSNDNMFQSPVFSSTIATLMNSQIEVFDTTGASGAARAAGVAIGIYHSLEEAIGVQKLETVYEPSMNFGQAHQAYTYWQSFLEHMLDRNISRTEASNFQRQQQWLVQLQQKEAELSKSLLQLENQRKKWEMTVNRLNQLVEKHPEISGLRKLSRELEEEVIDETSWEEFESHLHLLQDPFIQKLRNNYPGLTQQDLKLCALLRQKMNTKDIARILALSPRGVETKRYRLRKKLLLNNNNRLQEFIDQL